MSKICKSCGCIIENDNAKFCFECGEKFTEPVEQQNAEEKQTVPQTPTTSSNTRPVIRLSSLSVANDVASKEPERKESVNESSSEQSTRPEQSEVQNKTQSPVIKQERPVFNQVVDDDDEPPIVNDINKLVNEPEPSSPVMIDDEPEEEKAFSEEEIDSIDEIVVDDEDDVSPVSAVEFVPFQDLASTTSFHSDNDLITNDPYYDDVLPEINNEKVLMQKDVVLKLVGALFAMGLVICLLIYSFG